MPNVDGISWFFPAAPHRTSEVLADAFAKGMVRCGFEWFKAAADDGPIGKINTLYGILHGGEDIIRRSEGAGRPFYYIDHGYWGKSKSLSNLNGNFRIVRNALQHTEISKGPFAGRFDANPVDLLPARTYRPDYMVAIPPTKYQVSFYGRNILETFLERLRNLTPGFAEVHVSEKGDDIPLDEHLDKASFALGFNSTGMVEAARRGIKTETTGPSPLGELNDVWDKEEWERTRLGIFRGCADRQFTIEEIADGSACRTLQAIGEL